MLIRIQWFGNTLLRFSYIPALIAFFYFTFGIGIGAGIIIGLFIWAKYAVIGVVIESVAASIAKEIDKKKLKKQV